MATKVPPKVVAMLYLSLVSILASVFTGNSECSFSGKLADQDQGKVVKGMFVFGSSLVDNGNNNFLETKSKANYLPYGVDFSSGPTGRFTNGKNLIDLLGDELKLLAIPPFLDPSTKGVNIIHGVNHASGSAGILDDTGSIAGNVISLSQQIINFAEVTLPDLEAQLHCNSTESLPNYILVIGIGGNDYLFNYFLRRSFLSVNLDAFTANLISSLAQQLKNLYDLGGRKFVLTAINPLGDIPFIRNNINTYCIFCSQALNRAAQLYNSRLKGLVDDTKQNLAGSNLVAINTFNIINDIILNKDASQGISNTENPCCEVASSREGGNGISCKRDGNVCRERSSFVYFDGLHPTEAVNIQIASKAYSSSIQNDVYPINVSQLSQL